MVGRRAVVVDTETTDLRPDYVLGRGVIWEIALLEYGTERTEHLYRTEPDPSKADPAALRVNQYYERTRKMRQRDKRIHDLAATDLAARGGCWSDAGLLAAELAQQLDNVTLIAANPTFDANYLTEYLRAYRQAPTWHYRLRDIGSMAWAWLNGRELVTRSFLGEDDGVETGRIPRRIPDMDASTDDFARALGVDPDSFERHSALGDCRLLAAMLDVILGSPS